MLQPLLHCLFGTEEVGDASPTAQEHPGSGGVEFRHLPLIYQYVNRRAGVLGGIVDRHFLVQIFRVDQREKVDGSIGIELLQPAIVSDGLHVLERFGILNRDATAGGVAYRMAKSRYVNWEGGMRITFMAHRVNVHGLKQLDTY